MEVVLYRSRNQEENETALEALQETDFKIFVLSLPHFYKGCPGPVAHFCGRVVAFGQEQIDYWIKEIELEMSLNGRAPSC